MTENWTDRISWLLCAFLRAFFLWLGLVIAGWAYGADLRYPETLILCIAAFFFSLAISVVPHPNLDWRRGGNG